MPNPQFREYTPEEHQEVLRSALQRGVRLWAGPSPQECSDSIRVWRDRMGLEPTGPLCRICQTPLDPFLVRQEITVHMTCEFPP